MSGTSPWTVHLNPLGFLYRVAKKTNVSFTVNIAHTDRSKGILELNDAEVTVLFFRLDKYSISLKHL